MKFKRCLRIIIHLVIYNAIGLLCLWIIPWPATIGAHVMYILFALAATIGYEFLDYYGLISPYWFKS